jgi:6-phosphogluconolactonase (cycloisomerase 2 family)
MNKLLFLMLLWFCFNGTVSFAQNVGISPSGNAPDASAGLDVNFTDKGLLIPRVSLLNTTTANPVTDPAISLLVYNTATAGDVTPGYYFWNGTAWTRLSGSLSGSGTANYLPKWTDANTLGSSQVYDDGTNVGIGTVTPGAKLEVSGTLKVTDGSQGANKVLTSNAEGLASWQESELTELASAPCTSVGPYFLSGVTTEFSPQSVAVSGDYAYVVNANSNSLQIFNVSTPSGPYLVGSAATEGSSRSVAVSGDYAYVVNIISNSLQIFDVSTPSSPFLVGSAGTGSYPYSVAVSGDHAYVINGGTSNFLQIFNVSTPSSPYLAGSAGTEDNPQSVAVSGDYAYVVNGGSNSLQIFDVSTPSSPFLVGSAVTGIAPTSVAVSGDYAYVVNIISNSLQLFNVSTPLSPLLAGSTGTGGWPTSVAVSGDYAI